MIMYRDNEKHSFNWLKIFLRVLIAFLLLLLCIKVISIIVSNQEIKKTNNVLQENLRVLDDVAKRYFKDDILPAEAGESVKVSVSHLIDTEAIDELKDEKGISCNYDKSFIQITRLDSEYQIKSYLDCNGNTDYMNSFVEIKKANVTIKPITTKTTKKKNKKTTKKQTTTKVTTSNTIYYQVSFNTNGGNILPTQTIKKNSLVANVTPTREGYIFIGWYCNGSKFDFKTKIDRDYVLVAKWIKA